MASSSLKIVTILALALSFVVILAKAAEIMNSAGEEKVQTAPVEPAIIVPRKWEEVNFNPPVPDPLPDLHEGYLFNRDRHLDEPESDIADQALNESDIDLDEVRYAGSVISEELSVGIITYPKPLAPVRRRRRPVRRTSRKQQPEKRLSKRVKVGENVGGYQIKEILPDRIIFAKKSEQVEKALYDPEKNRITLPRKPPQRAARTVKKTSRAPRSARQRTLRKTNRN